MDKSSSRPHRSHHPAPDPREVADVIRDAVGSALRGSDPSANIEQAAGVVVLRVNEEATVGERFPLAEAVIRDDVAKRVSMRWAGVLEGLSALDDRIVARLLAEVVFVFGPDSRTAMEMMKRLGIADVLFLSRLPPHGREAFIEAVLRREFTADHAWRKTQPVGRPSK